MRIPSKDNSAWRDLITTDLSVSISTLAARLFTQRLRRNYRNDPSEDNLRSVINEAYAYFVQNQVVLGRDIEMLFGGKRHSVDIETAATQKLVSLEDAKDLISTGHPLMFAGSHRSLMSLPKGNWIAGTIPYYMTSRGGVKDESRVFVTEFPETLSGAKIEVYSSDRLSEIPKGYYDNGVSFVIMPGGSPIAETYARNAINYRDLFKSPLVGWLSGTLVELIGKEPPLVFNGQTGKSHTNHAVVMHLSVAAKFRARIETFNAFEMGRGPEISFDEEGFSITKCKVSGREFFFADYLKEIKADTRFPLMSDYMGTKVNVAIQKIDPDTKEVSFYAPVFRGVTYQFAKPLGDYVEAFSSHAKNLVGEPFFSCNCILNYLYAELEGKKTGSIVGPFTFGEIAFIVLNQTLVYVTLDRST